MALTTQYAATLPISPVLLPTKSVNSRMNRRRNTDEADAPLDAPPAPPQTAESSAPPQEPLAATAGRGKKLQYHKTKVCPWNERGKCFMGEHCNYAHARGELQPKPDLSRTKLCPEVEKNRPCSNSNCRYAHDLNELRATNAFFKTKLCKFWLKGYCPCGRSCRHAHGREELRRPSTTAKDRGGSCRVSSTKFETAHKGNAETGRPLSSASVEPPEPSAMSQVHSPLPSSPMFPSSGLSPPIHWNEWASPHLQSSTLNSEDSPMLSRQLATVRGWQSVPHPPSCNSYFTADLTSTKPFSLPPSQLLSDLPTLDEFYQTASPADHTFSRGGGRDEELTVTFMMHHDDSTCAPTPTSGTFLSSGASPVDPLKTVTWATPAGSCIPLTPSVTPDAATWVSSGDLVAAAAASGAGTRTPPASRASPASMPFEQTQQESTNFNQCLRELSQLFLDGQQSSAACPDQFLAAFSSAANLLMDHDESQNSPADPVLTTLLHAISSSPILQSTAPPSQANKEGIAYGSFTAGASARYEEENAKGPPYNAEEIGHEKFWFPSDRSTSPFKADSLLHGRACSQKQSTTTACTDSSTVVCFPSPSANIRHTNEINQVTCEELMDEKFFCSLLDDSRIEVVSPIKRITASSDFWPSSEEEFLSSGVSTAPGVPSPVESSVGLTPQPSTVGGRGFTLAPEFGLSQLTHYYSLL